MKCQCVAMKVMPAFHHRACTSKSLVCEKYVVLENCLSLNLNWKTALTPREEQGEIVRDGRTERLLTEGKTHISVLLLQSMETPESAEHTRTHIHIGTHIHTSQIQLQHCEMKEKFFSLQHFQLNYCSEFVCMRVCVCVCVHAWVSLCVWLRACVCLCVWLRVPVCMFNRRGVCIWVLALMASRCAARATEAWRERVYVCVCVSEYVCVLASLMSPCIISG